MSFFDWRGWHVVKWIFGGVLCIFIIAQIWGMNTKADYEDELRVGTISAIKNAERLVDFRKLASEWQLFERENKIKNIK